MEQPIDWANETLSVTRMVYAYFELDKPVDSIQTPLDDEFRMTFAPIVEERAQMAGVRLANVLEDILGD